MGVLDERRKFRKNILKNLIVFAVTFVSILIFFHFIRFPVVDGESMHPTYENGDVVVTLYTKNVKDNDVVVLWSDVLGEYLVKRVIGTAGDHIVIADGQLYRNGARLYESYLNSYEWADIKDEVDIVVPEDTIYVMGDNRNESADSRAIGLLSVDDIFGRVLFKAKIH